MSLSKPIYPLLSMVKLKKTGNRPDITEKLLTRTKYIIKKNQNNTFFHMR